MKTKVKKRRKISKTKVLFVCLGIFFVAVFAVQTARLYQKNQALVAEEEALSEQVEELEDEQESLYEEQEYVQTDEYVESTAREKMNMVMPGETVFRESE